MADVVWVRGAARILDPGSGIDRVGDLWVVDGRVGGVGQAPPPALRAGARLVEAEGALVTPMFIDLHVHLREPGMEEAETIETGTRAALAGGYAVVYAMPNTDPPCDTPQAVRRVREQAARAGPCEVVPVAALSRGLLGAELTDLDALADAGAGAFSDDGRWLADPALAERAFRWAARRGALVMQHCEDPALAGEGVLHESEAVRAAGLPGLDPRAEDLAVARDVALARRLGTRLHVCHVSTAGAVEAIRRGQGTSRRPEDDASGGRGAQPGAGLVRGGGGHGERGKAGHISGEAAPHHLLLTVEDALAGGPDFKMKPPLRDLRDVEAVRSALEDGVLEAVATDHAPHPEAHKACGLRDAPFGAIGLETAFAACWTGLVLHGHLRAERLIEALTSGPARIAGREAPRLVPGLPAAINVIDLTSPRRVERAASRSRSRNCPFHGMALTGWPVASVLGTRLILHRPPPLAAPRG